MQVLYWGRGRMTPEEEAETGRKVVNATRQKRRQISPEVEAMQQEMRMLFGTKVASWYYSSKSDERLIRQVPERVYQ